MGELMTAMVVFACLGTASIGMMYLYPRLSARHRDDETNTVLRLVANIFVVMTSLVFGLLINSSKNTFETIDANVHAYSTSLIMFDRALRTYGREADETHQRLVEYIEAAIAHPARGDDALPDPGVGRAPAQGAGRNPALRRIERTAMVDFDSRQKKARAWSPGRVTSRSSADQLKVYFAPTVK